MRKLVFTAAFVALFIGVAAAQHEHGHEAKAPETVTLVGEVLDMYCFMKHPENGQGPEHAKCAMSCIKKGLPIGFLSDGKVYLIVGKEHESAADMTVEFAGVQSKLTGVFVEHHGVKAIEIQKIEGVDKAGG
jgi:hypothetical protein